MDKLERLRDMRDDYEAALDGAARLRDDYHRELVKLHRSGMSLREIAEALGISHQRVHQIVSPRDEETIRPKRKAAGAVVASAIVVCLIAAGAALFIRSGKSEPPIASSVAPTARPNAGVKDEACARFLEIFRDQRSIAENVNCAEVTQATSS